MPWIILKSCMILGNTPMSRTHWPALLQIAASVVLLLSALFQLFDTMFEEIIGVEISAAHGVAVFALVKLVKEGVELREKLAETRERIGEVQHEIAEEKAAG